VAVFGIGLEGKPPYFGLILGIVLGGALAGVFYWQVAIPKRDEIAKKDRELKALQVKIQEGRAAEQKLEQFRAEVRRLELELEKLLRILPARRNTPELLRRVRTLAEQGDFDFAQFKPGKMVEQEFFSEWPITVDLSGNYHNLALLFDRIRRFPRILNIDNLRIDAIQEQSPTRTVRASFIAKTFVYTQPEAEDGAEGGATDEEPSR
jgi:type IV pilus assembly protein PilO